MKMYYLLTLFIEYIISIILFYISFVMSSFKNIKYKIVLIVILKKAFWKFKVYSSFLIKYNCFLLL